MLLLQRVAQSVDLVLAACFDLSLSRTGLLGEEVFLHRGDAPRRGNCVIDCSHSGVLHAAEALCHVGAQLAVLLFQQNDTIFLDLLSHLEQPGLAAAHGCYAG